MCLDRLTAFVIEEDGVFYKWVSKHKDRYFGTSFMVEGCSTGYVVGVQYNADILEIGSPRYESGFHGFTSIKDAELARERMGKLKYANVLVKCQYKGVLATGEEYLNLVGWDRVSVIVVKQIVILGEV